MPGASCPRDSVSIQGLPNPLSPPKGPPPGGQSPHSQAELPLSYEVLGLRVVSPLEVGGHFVMTTRASTPLTPSPVFLSSPFNFDSLQARMNPKTKEAGEVEGNEEGGPADTRCRLEVRDR